MRFGILGPLLVTDGSGVEIPVVGARPRVLLAALVARANQVVGADELAEVVWDGAPPPAAARTVRRYLTRVRRAVGPEVAGRIVTRSPGYAFLAGEDEVDLLRFEACCARGGAAVRAHDWARAADLLGGALALWRGTPLQDAPSRVLREVHVPSLDRLRAQALEWRIEADLNLGRHDDLVPELSRLVEEHPLREHVHGLLMLALYRGGRQGEALAAYRDARRVLVAELGVEPAGPLRELHQRILAGDPALDGPPAGAVARSVPRQLPAGGPHFTGRAGALRALTGLAARAEADRSAVVVSAIGGAAGIGKTALALRWGQENAHRFPDGQLYANLRGFDPAGVPVPAGTAVLGFLEALGVPAARIPATPDARSALYRSELAGRRVLVVLDNARDADQVRPLLPGTPGCLVLVTSRDALTGLVAVDGAHPLSLDLLTTTEARALLAHRLGADRVAAEPEAVDELVGLCARLPLALNIAAAHALARPDVPLATLAGRLRDTPDRLSELDTGEDAGSVRAVLSWSSRDLDPDAARLFRLLGLHPGADLDRYAAAALADLPVHRVDLLLDRLTRAHLVHTAGPDRFGMHDLLRAHARDLTTPHEERRAALSRLSDHYLCTAATAMDTLFPFEGHRRPRVDPPPAPGPPVHDAAGARAWLDAERATLAAIAEHGRPEDAIRLSATLSRYLMGGVHAEALAIHHAARRAAHGTGDSHAEATALARIAIIDHRQGRFRRALLSARRALELFREVGDRLGEARALLYLGLVAKEQGHVPEATAHFEQALDLFRETGDRLGQAKAVGSLGALALEQGRHREAADRNRLALDLFREIGDRTSESHTLVGLGELSSREGRHEEATGHLRLALALSREVGDRSGEARGLDALGVVHRCQGGHEQAEEHHRRAAELFRELGDRAGEARALVNLGALAAARHRHQDAASHYRLALDLSREIGHPSGEAAALSGLAEVAATPSGTGTPRARTPRAGSPARPSARGTAARPT
ncbi:AfsR/SARP family transcriptional regulator [Umezawaea tangerina]|uniref:AfsR/SARP family transcriptional regulator n=1 Tax=Umezawaea tangerina TaxID=84725 RepID=UPI001474BC3B|nr:BTAD domain-containing putative transcriptional regulator [Umezawaea tangerina]